MLLLVHLQLEFTEAQKNPQYAIRIFYELSKMNIDSISRFEMHFYGNGSLVNSIRELADEYRVCAVFHGIYQREDVPNITSENDIFLITSITEGQCIVALEVLAGGRPLFATAVGALPEILKDEKRGKLLPENNAAEAASLIVRWLNKYQNLSREEIQLSYLDDFDIDKIKQQYVYLIKNFSA